MHVNRPPIGDSGMSQTLTSLILLSGVRSLVIGCLLSTQTLRCIPINGKVENKKGPHCLERKRQSKCSVLCKALHCS